MSMKAAQHESPRDEAVLGGAHGARPTLLLVSKHDTLSETIIDNALSLAQRLGAAIVAVYVNTLPDYHDEDVLHCIQALKSFEASVTANSRVFEARAAKAGVAFSHALKVGRLDYAIAGIFKEYNKIDIVLVESDIAVEKVAQVVPVPIFSLSDDGGARMKFGDGKGILEEKSDRIAVNRATGGRSDMSQKRKQATIKAVIYGLATAGLYAAVFMNSEIVMEYCTKGGIYAIAPVAMVFAFSYVHGTFTSNFWSAFGIEASRKTTTTAVTKPVEKTERPRARMYA